MPVGIVQLEIVLPESGSLKDRRQIVRSLKDRLRHEFNVSVAEMDATPDLWQRATIALAAIGPDAAYLLALLQRAAQAAETMLAGQRVICGEAELICLGICHASPS